MGKMKLFSPSPFSISIDLTIIFMENLTDIFFINVILDILIENLNICE